MGMAEAILGAAVAAGQIPEQPLRPLAYVLMGCGSDEAALYVARAEDPEGGPRRGRPDRAPADRGTARME
jgi:hypothetical protein